MQMLVQSGCRLSLAGLTIYVDPYLSDSVEELDAPDLRRKFPIARKPSEITDADWVMLTHVHIDHCDPHTIPELAVSSPQARFLGPPPVISLLQEWGICEDRLIAVREDWFPLEAGVNIRAVS